jgi:hypothetical protein
LGKITNVCSVHLTPPPQDENWAGQPKPDTRPDGLWVGFGQVFGKNHLTQIQPNPTGKPIWLGLGRQFDDWVIFLPPDKFPEPELSQKGLGFWQQILRFDPTLTQ